MGISKGPGSEVLGSGVQRFRPQLDRLRHDHRPNVAIHRRAAALCPTTAHMP
jgi:hypothetical protein